MQPLPSDISRQDMDQWCSRGVVMVLDDDIGYYPAWYQGAMDNSAVLTTSVDSALRRTEVRTPKSRVYVHWPTCGSINLPGLGWAMHAARIVQRQYSRTWRASGLTQIIPRRWDVARFKGISHDAVKAPSVTLAKACFMPEYPSLDEAEARLSSGDAVTVAISPTIIVAGDRTGKRMFYFNGDLCATACDGVLYPVDGGVAINRIVKLTEGRYTYHANQ